MTVISWLNEAWHTENFDQQQYFEVLAFKRGKKTQENEFILRTLYK